jgi:hypothetical protein
MPAGPEEESAMTLSNRTFALAAALALAGLAPTPTFGDLTLSVTRYDQAFPDGSEFHLLGTPSQTINLIPGVATDLFLDGSGGAQIAVGADYTGDASGAITLGGISQSFSDNYRLTHDDPRLLIFSGGPPIVFHLGTFDVTVTPIASQFVREASFLETLTAAVPEPSSVWVAALGGAGLAGYGWRRSRRPRASG